MSNSIDNGDKQDWWIDSTAMHHMTMHKDWLLDYKKFDKKLKISLVDGEQKSIKAHGCGSVRIVSHIDNKMFIRLVLNVFFVPDITRNIFSVLAEQRIHPESVYKSTLYKCEFLINNEQEFVGSRNRKEPLYRMECSIVRPPIDLISISEEKVLELYHQRWGHLDKSHICKMLKLYSNFDLKQTDGDEVCEFCPLSELHKLTFGTIETCKRPGDIVSAFLCDSMNVKSLKGKRYYLLIEDHYSHYRYVKMLKDKSHSKIIEKIKSVRKNEQKHIIGEFVLDLGLDFNDSKIRDYLVKRGINLRPGTLDRENGLILEMVRSFKRSTFLPDSLWPEFVKTAVQILNKLGRSSVEDESPYEVWWNRKPTIEHLRIIGSKCYVRIDSKRRQQVRVGYFVGYNDKTGRYRIYIPTLKGGKVKEFAYKDLLFDFDEQIVECRSSIDAEYKTENFEIKALHEGVINIGLLDDDDDCIVTVPTDQLIDY